jgi:hypothetical protein
MGVSVDSDGKRGFGPSIELITKSAAVCIGFLYVCGLLVVTLYLAQFGVSSPGLVQLQFVGAGVLLIAPLFLTYFVVALVSTNLQLAQRRSPSDPPRPPGTGSLRRLWKTFWFLAMAMVVGSTILKSALPLFMADSENGMMHWSTLRPYLYLMVMAVVLAYFVYYSCLGWRLVWICKAAAPVTVKTIARPFVMTALCLIYFLGYASYFASKIYPQVPHELGGGKPLTIVFLLKPVVGNAMQPVVPDTSGTRSIPYKLLLETDNAYIVLSPDTKEFVVRINQDAVNGITVLKGL